MCYRPRIHVEQGIGEILLRLDTPWVKEWGSALIIEIQGRMPKSAHLPPLLLSQWALKKGRDPKRLGAIAHPHLLRDRRVGAQLKTSKSRSWYIKSLAILGEWPPDPGGK